eukprot:Gb_31785 [translate_table: standard]
MAANNLVLPSPNAVLPPLPQCEAHGACRSVKRPSEVDLEDILVVEEADWHQLCSSIISPFGYLSDCNPSEPPDQTISPSHHQQIHKFVETVNIPERDQSASFAEQLRRKRMNDLFTTLKSLLPSALPKRDRCGLLEETCNYIRKLQDDLQQLNRRSPKLQANKFVSHKPLALAAETLNSPTDKISPDVEVKFYGSEGIIRISCLRKPRNVWRIMEEIEEHGLDLQMSQFFTGGSFFFLYFHGIFQTQTCPTPQIQTSLESRLKTVY